MQCKCSSYYTGDSCYTPVDYCALYKPCNPLSYDYNINYTCIEYSVPEQIAANRTYYCNGTCPNMVGYFKNQFGLCLGKIWLITNFGNFIKLFQSYL